MLITKVELEDVKSHRNSKFEFQPGTTAITGANGAGKTTIIEAIAWALFDFLEYNRDDFVRRGARKGAVRVTFKSGLDNRLYTIYRDTTGKHWVFDEESKAKLHEQNQNVVNFIRQHLQVEPGTNLKELYRAAIGVPQGTFTAVFLDNAGGRKAVFDRLLKVEEYRESAKKLGETAGLIKDKQKGVEIRLAVAENELRLFDETEAEHRQIVGEIGELETALGKLGDEVAARTAAVAEFEAARARLEQAETLWRAKTQQRDNAEFQLAQKQREQTAAETARARMLELEPDFKIYEAAEIARQTLERDRDERDRLRNDKNRIEKSQIDARAGAQFLNKDLSQAVAAGTEADQLAPKIIEQETLENEYKALLAQSAEIGAAAARAASLGEEVAQKRREYTELREQIKDGEKSANAPEQIESLEKTRAQIETDLTAADKAAALLAVLKPQVRQTSEEIENLNETRAKIKTQIAGLEAFATKAALVGELTEVETSLREKIANLRATIELDQKYQHTIRKGVCPILPDKCLNLRETVVLTNYLDNRSTANQDALKNFETERQKIQLDLNTARDAEKNAAKLPALRDQLESIEKQIAAREQNSRALRLEIAAQQKFTPEKHNELRVEKATIELELKVLHQAAKKHAALEGLRKRLEDLQNAGKKLAEEQKRLQEIADREPQTKRRISENQQRLRQLNNPKARVENLRQTAAKADELRQSLVKVNDQVEQLDRERARLDAALEKFAALDEKLASVRRDLERTRAARDQYLQNRLSAEKLPEIVEKLGELTAESARLKTEVEAAAEARESASRSYNLENHRAEIALLDGARASHAATNATLTAKRARETQLGEILRRLCAVRDRMHDDLQEQDRLRLVWETTDYIRETLKKAAPHVGEILRYEITKEATNLFREITGEAGCSLKWTDDYEILLDENGYQRPFANLSGGEQMAAALSIRLALLTELSDVRIAFFDEPTTNLDRERRERLAQQIGQIRNFNQLFVISHDDTFESNVDHRIDVGNVLTE